MQRSAGEAPAERRIGLSDAERKQTRLVCQRFAFGDGAT
jgi:hypothetical protein